MRYLVGVSQEETAAALGIATGTVAATAHQAAARLRARLGDCLRVSRSRSRVRAAIG